MRSVLRAARSGAVAATRIVCLPGAYHIADDFLAAGFDERVNRGRLPVDLVFVDVEMRNLGDRSILAQLKQQIVLPARSLGCRTLWFAGISLGGFIALDYAASNPGELDGVCLLAPYLGSRMLTGEIARAPGLNAWKRGDLEDSCEERRVWGYLQSEDVRSRLLYLGYGQDDRFAEAHRLLAQVLPPSAVNVIPGAHDWRTWTTLWENFLAKKFG